MGIYFAHESKLEHIHTGDSSTPAVYFGIISLAAIILIIVAVLILSKQTAKKPKKDQD